MEHKELIDEMVRDFTTVVPRSKSEVRRRIESLLSLQRKEIREMIEGKYGKFGSMHGSYGYQGIVMGITEFQTPEDTMRDAILSALTSHEVENGL